MMWAYAIKSKITAALLLFAVLAMVLLTNFGERSNADKINTAIASIYKDRLVVEGYIFDHARLLQQADAILDGNKSTAQKQELISKQLAEVFRLNTLYAATQLTPDEKTNFDNFTELCAQLNGHVAAGNFEEARLLMVRADGILHTLSGIQMQEAKTQMDNVHRMSSFSSILSQFELGVVIIIAILVQILVFSSKTLSSIKYPGKAHLN